MLKLIKNILFAGVLLGLSAGAIYWTEAEKEIRILCLMFDAGESADYVTKTLNTGNLLKYERSGDKLMVWSNYDLHSNRCTVEFAGNDIINSRTYVNYFDLKAWLVWGSTFVSLGFIVFHGLLAKGYPIGAYAWGGKNEVLPKKFRYGSLFSAILFAVVVLLLLGANLEFLRIAETYPVLGLVFMISAFFNFNTGSVKEKRMGVPLAVLLYLSFLVLSLQ
ncbi:hypothetical protein [Gracilimonas amylolytica]|uniref:hypothetical protein n=1 Tax=Gracilimonas amylolytica TaxID=1749045 RepID=UPI000CD9ACA2|nr:hypothetical protein [Gracilimonas amylolytica]